MNLSKKWIFALLVILAGCTAQNDNKLQNTLKVSRLPGPNNSGRTLGQFSHPSPQLSHWIFAIC